MSQTIRPPVLDCKDPTTWVQPFIHHAQQAKPEIVPELEKAKLKVADHQTRKIELPAYVYLTEDHRKELLQMIAVTAGTPVDCFSFEKELTAEVALEIIEYALDQQFVSEAIGIHIDGCLHDFEKFCTPTGRTMLVPNLETMTADQVSVTSEELYQNAYRHLAEADEQMKRFKSGKEISDEDLKGYKQGFQAKVVEIVGDDGFVTERYEIPYAERSSGGKKRTPRQVHYLGWTLNEGILKVDKELPYIGAKDHFMRVIKDAYQRACAAIHAHEELVKIFQDIGNAAGYDYISVKGKGIPA